jgi:hypothetical protein
MSNSLTADLKLMKEDFMFKRHAAPKLLSLFLIALASTALTIMRIQKSLISSILFGFFVWLAVMAVAQAQTPTVQIKHVRVLGDTVRVE